MLPVPHRSARPAPPVGQAAAATPGRPAATDTHQAPASRAITKGMEELRSKPQQPARPTPYDTTTGAVLAAVDDPGLAVPVARRAAEQAQRSGRRLVVVVVIPVGGGRLGDGGRLADAVEDYDDALAMADRIRPAIEESGVVCRLEVRGYRARGGPRRRARRIATAVLHAARQAGATVLVLGQRRHRGAAGASVATRIAHGAPAGVQVIVEQLGAPDGAERARPAAGVAPAAAPPAAGALGPEPVVLTAEGRRLLAARARRLQARVLPELRAALADRDRDGRVDADYERTASELWRLCVLVERAVAAEDLPDDPDRVELGELVTVQIESGPPERFLIVHPVEAPLDELRISSASPLARALLGQRVGEEVEVRSPTGPYRCRILAAVRAGAQEAAAEPSAPTGG